MDLSRVPHSPSSGLVNLLVTSPAGSRHRYEFAPESGLFVLTGVLDASIVHPFDHGFIPNTIGADGKPLAAMVITAEPTFSGCLIQARPIGLLELQDDSLCLCTLLCIPAADLRQDSIRTIRQIAPTQLDEIAEFCRSMRHQEGGVPRRQGWRDVDAVPQILKSCAASAG